MNLRLKSDVPPASLIVQSGRHMAGTGSYRPRSRIRGQIPHRARSRSRPDRGGTPCSGSGDCGPPLSARLSFQSPDVLFAELCFPLLRQHHFIGPAIIAVHSTPLPGPHPVCFPCAGETRRAWRSSRCNPESVCRFGFRQPADRFPAPGPAAPAVRDASSLPYPGTGTGLSRKDFPNRVRMPMGMPISFILSVFLHQADHHIPAFFCFSADREHRIAMEHAAADDYFIVNAVPFHGRVE